MRAGLVAVLIGVVLAFAPPGFSVASAKAPTGVFPDLPGLAGAERLTHARAPSAHGSAGTTAKLNATKSARVPAPDSTSSSKQKIVSDDAKAFIQDLPGGAQLPVLGANPSSAGGPGADVPAALAFVVVVLFTRFLFRLNHLGSSA